MAKIQFAPTEFAQEVAGLYETGYQRGVSVGFKPLKFEERRHEKTGAFLGIRFLEQELLEASAVPVPANRNALRRAMEQAPRLKEYLAGFEEQDGTWAGVKTGQGPGQGFGQGFLEGSGLSMAALNMAGNTAQDAIWPQISAQVDELGKLVDELAEMVEAAGLASPRSFSPGGFSPGGLSPSAFGRLDVGQVLSALRDVAAPVTSGGGGPAVVRRR